jgi:hypothetical protein
MRFEFDDEALSNLVRKIIGEIAAELGWPQGRVALTEQEAAAACGVGRHVLRDLRLAGRLEGTKLGRRVVYTRGQLLAALSGMKEIA